MNILIVDDQESMREFIVRVVDSLGHTHVTAMHGRQCIELCQDKKFDVILLDLVMPIMDGESTLRELRTNCPESDVVIVSVQDDEQAIRELLAEGATAFLCKPFKPSQLSSLLSEIEEKRLARLQQTQ